MAPSGPEFIKQVKSEIEAAKEFRNAVLGIVLRRAVQSDQGAAGARGGDGSQRKALRGRVGRLAAGAAEQGDAGRLLERLEASQSRSLFDPARLAEAGRQP